MHYEDIEVFAFQKKTRIASATHTAALAGIRFDDATPDESHAPPLPREVYAQCVQIDVWNGSVAP